MKSYAPPKLRQVVTEAVFRRRRIVLLTLYIVLGLVLLGSLLMHRKYQATAKLMVQNVRSLAPLGTSPAEKIVQQGDISVTEVNSEVDLLQSQGVARRALRKDADPTHIDSVAEQKKITALEHALTVDPVHQTSLIDVTLLANSPQEAEAKLGDLLNAYFEERSGTGLASGAAEFFSRQVQDKSAQLDADTKSLTDFEVAHTITDLDAQKKLQVERIAAIEDRLNDASASLAKQQSTASSERHLLVVTPSRSVTSQKVITNQYSQEHLDSELVDLQNRRAELAKRYAPTDRAIVELDEKIATVQKAISNSKQHPAGEDETDVNPVWQTLTSAVATSSGEVSGLAAQRNELARQMKEATDRLNELQESTGQYDTLSRKLAQTKADYQMFVQKRDEASVSDALDKQKMFDVSLVQPPMASYEAVRPKPLLYMASGLVFALLLGTALALYTDTSAEQVYTPAQLDALTGTRTIATFADEDYVGSDYSGTPEYRRVLFAIRNTLAEHRVAGAAEGPGGYVVGFTSALRGEGVTFVLQHLATEAARQAAHQAGTKIALLDMRSLLRRFESEGKVSFGMRFDERRKFWSLAGEDGEESTDVAAPQMQGGAQGQFSVRLLPLLVEARKQFDLIFLDCPSLEESALASELDGCVDGYIAVASAGRARKPNIERLDATLRETRAPLLGFVLNRRRYPVPGWLHRLLWSRA